MIIVIKKQEKGDFFARVADPTLTYASDPNVFDEFKDGIIARGTTWGEALDNIRKQINKYITIYRDVMGEFPGFAKDKTTSIISENLTSIDLLK